MAWNLHPFYFEKLDEVLKDSLVLPLSSCRSIKFLVLFRIGWKLETNLFFSSVQPKMLFFALHLNHDTAESTRVCWNIWHAIRCGVSSLSLSLSHVSTIRILSKFLVADLLSFLLLISMAWNLHPFCFEKLDEVLKDSLVRPPEVDVFCLTLKFDTAESGKGLLETLDAIRQFQASGPFILSVVISIAWNHSSFCFEKSNEVLKDHWCLPYSSCRWQTFFILSDADSMAGSSALFILKSSNEVLRFVVLL
ncbi:hypothetical protein Tco_0936200 [Tanacetum coccineum]